MSETSPPARVAWIETRYEKNGLLIIPVATREGGVDRNDAMRMAVQAVFRRHPRGWRG